ncbi:MAG TPA: amidohydrolase [Gemmatimonadales bacterium]|jgi:predicted amidohydrolase YtcJ|nr:amidohydrolase [Gemmatimonadales bacterium]
MFRPAPLILALALAGCASSHDSGSLAPPTAADLVVYGRVWTGDTAAPWAGGVAVLGDTIAAVGDSATLAAWVGASTRVIDNGRAMVTPGLMDGHAHFSSGGFQLASVDLRDAATPAEFIQRLKTYAKTLKPGEWITGGDWDHERWTGAPLPRRDWIDSVTPDNPVFVNRLDGHMGLANSLALKAARVSAATPDEAGGTIVRDADRTPTGILKDGAQDAVYAAMPDPTPEQMDSALARATNWAASKGVTAVSAVSAPWAEVASARRLRKAGLLKTRISFYPALGGWHRVADSLKANGPGDDWIRVAGVKGFVDGSLGSGTALFFEPYADDPSTFGLLVTPEDSLRAWIGAADSAGLQVVVHAIGERANALILDIYDSVIAAHGQRDRRFRVEHAQHLRPQDVPRFGKLGVIASMQPYHAADDGRWAEKRLGPERVKHSYVFRSLLDRGARLAFGSDWSVAPLDPMLGIAAAVTRQTLDGKNPGGWLPEEKISVDEALHGYSTGDAYAMFAERSIGMLKPGYKADLLLLDRDLTTIRPDELWKARVRTTVVGGKVVYKAAQD